MALSGDKLTAMATVSAQVDTDGSTTSTTYTNVLSGSSVPGVAFIAPPSGKVTIFFSAAGYNSGVNDNKTSVRVRTGGTVGSGTIVLGANDADLDRWMLLRKEANNYRGTSFAEVTGLTPGDTYNVQMLHKVGAGTGNFLFKFIKVIPDL